MKNIVRDDFNDDGTNTDERIDPILLPRIEKEEYSDEEVDKKPIILENGEGKNIYIIIFPIIFHQILIYFSFTVLDIKEEILSKHNKKEVTIHQIIENKINPYILMQVGNIYTVTM